MARFTTAYSSFVTRLDEVNDLRKTAAAREREDAVGNRDHISALCRGSIVFLCAHLEAYVKELGETALDAIVLKCVDRSKVSPRLFYHISKPLIEEIKDTTDHDRIAAKVFDFISTEIPYWNQAGPFSASISSEVFNKGFSNPAYKKIRAYLNRFGCDTYQRDLGHVLGADYQPVTNMVNHLVEVRNKIAHGDPTASKTPAEIKTMMDIIKRFSSTTDQVFASWCRTNLCTIR